MTKAEVKTICEGDDKLAWWAMVLFAEICELAQQGLYMKMTGNEVYPIVFEKTKEFERLILQRMGEIAANKPTTLEQRVAKLEQAWAEFNGGPAVIESHR